MADNIRLFRLLPNKNEGAVIQGELFEYCLQESSKATHLYEALSYVWGSLEKRESIRIGDDYFETTPNLHAALLHLRDHALLRIIWIDAICINQSDDHEKAHQIQSMAKIYGFAIRVIVWLGQAADSSDEALEAIRAVGREPTITLEEEPTNSLDESTDFLDEESTNSMDEESTNSLDENTTKQAVTSLLQRQWFRRIWVLQEVAAARNILILCGTTEIDGYAFYSGLNQVQGLYKGLRNQVRAVTYLMRGAIYRSKLVSNIPGRVSLDICSLGELMDMYHTYEATQRHDKIYALLGMSSDNISEVGLSPDYKVPWDELLQRLVRFLLGGQIYVKTWNDKEVAEIHGRGCVLGRVSQAKRYSDGSQDVRIETVSKKIMKLTLQATPNTIQCNDVVCLVQGAQTPTIIRPYEHYFAVVMISATPMKGLEVETSQRHFPLIWDWEGSAEKSKYPEKVSRYNLRQPLSLWNGALILEDSGQEWEAKTWKREAIHTWVRTSERGHRNPIPEEVLADILRYSKIRDVTLLFDRKGNEIQITEAVVKAAAGNSNYEIIGLLLERKGDKIQITETVLEAAAKNRVSGKEVMELLLDRKGDEIEITEAVLVAAAKNRVSGKEVMEYLLGQKLAEVHITDVVVMAAAVNNTTNSTATEMMNLLIDRKGDKI